MVEYIHDSTQGCHIYSGSLYFAALLCGALYLYIVHATSASIFSSMDNLPHTQVAMVLGASVTAEGVLSRF